MAELRCYLKFQVYEGYVYAINSNLYCSFELRIFILACIMVGEINHLPLFYLIQHLLLILIILKNILSIIKGGFHMGIDVVPEWMMNLDDEDVSFIKKFLLASGSLKEIANQYSVTYPTVRLRLDKLIQKIQISEDVANEPYISLIKRLAINDKVDFETAKLLISEYKKMKGAE